MRAVSFYDLAKHVPVPMEPLTNYITMKIIGVLFVTGILFWVAGWLWLSTITLFLAGAVFAALLILVAIEAHQDKVLNDIAMREHNEVEKKYEIG